LSDWQTASSRALEQGQRQPRAGLSISLAGEALAHQVRHVIAGRVAVQHLHQKGMDRDHGTQRPLAPHMAQFVAQSFDHGRLQMRRYIRLDLPQRGEDTVDHPWPPGSWIAFSTPSSRRPFCFPTPNPHPAEC
jgi:hypothetical protein